MPMGGDGNAEKCLSWHGWLLALGGDWLNCLVCLTVNDTGSGWLLAAVFDLLWWTCAPTTCACDFANVLARMTFWKALEFKHAINVS